MHQTIITSTTNLIIIIRIIQIISYLFREAIHQIVRQTSGEIHFYILNWRNISQYKKKKMNHFLVENPVERQNRY